MAYVNCQRCSNTKCERYGKAYGYTCCDHFVSQKKTNADRIRAMSDEELAKWLEYEGGGACAEVCGWLDWLQQPAEEDT